MYVTTMKDLICARRRMFNAWIERHSRLEVANMCPEGVTKTKFTILASSQNVSLRDVG